MKILPTVDRSKARNDMKVPRPAVSVVIPHYNQHQFIERCIASVACQLGREDEIIIVDDHSYPPLSIETGNCTPCVRVVSLAQNKGPGAARNLGVKQAKHNYIAFLDADDVALSGRIITQLNVMRRNPDWVGCVGDYVYQRGGKRDVQANLQAGLTFNIRRKLIAGHIFAAGSTLMVKRQSFLEVGGYNPALRVYEDWDLLLRLVLRSKIGYSSIPLAIISASTRRAGKDDRLRILSQLDDSYSRSLSPKEYCSFQQALAYERASTYFRAKKVWRGLEALLVGFRYAPLTLSRRLMTRIFWGAP